MQPIRWLYKRYVNTTKKNQQQKNQCVKELQVKKKKERTLKIKNLSKKEAVRYETTVRVKTKR